MKITGKTLMIISFIMMLAVTGCEIQSNTVDEANQVDNIDKDSGEENMDDMPCHQMPDGTWMGKCDEN